MCGTIVGPEQQEVTDDGENFMLRKVVGWTVNEVMLRK
jgi:hypothetical protein